MTKTTEIERSNKSFGNRPHEKKSYENRTRDKNVWKSYASNKKSFWNRSLVKNLRKSYAWSNHTEIVRVTKSYGIRIRLKIGMKSYAGQNLTEIERIKKNLRKWFALNKVLLKSYARHNRTKIVRMIKLYRYRALKKNCTEIVRMTNIDGNRTFEWIDRKSSAWKKS